MQGHGWLEEEVSTATAAVPWGGKQWMQEHMRLPPCSTPNGEPRGGEPRELEAACLAHLLLASVQTVPQHNVQQPVIIQMRRVLQGHRWLEEEVKHCDSRHSGPLGRTAVDAGAHTDMMQERIRTSPCKPSQTGPAAAEGKIGACH